MFLLELTLLDREAPSVNVRVATEPDSPTAQGARLIFETIEKHEFASDLSAGTR